MTEQKSKLPIVKILLITAVLISVLVISALNHYLSDQRVRVFASEAAGALKKRICPSEYVRAHPCGQKNVQAEADSGLIAYLYIYGITDGNDINELNETTKTLRSSESYYRRIPVKVIFYADLKKSSVVKQFWILGE